MMFVNKKARSFDVSFCVGTLCLPKQIGYIMLPEATFIVQNLPFACLAAVLSLANSNTVVHIRPGVENST